MYFIKEELIGKDIERVQRMGLYNPVTGVPTKPKYCIYNIIENIYLFSLMERVVSHSIDMPRYFLLLYKNSAILFYVIESDDTISLEEDKIRNVSRVLDVKGLRVPHHLKNEVKMIRKIIFDSVRTYYRGTKVRRIKGESSNKIGYYNERDWVNKNNKDLQMKNPFI